ncbi:UTRA domain-containing protein, partial [Staphylococcus epidermidis]|uniref:UTRA domain-containing protein n=1 Tax=Staphylococcus epidermidis TaxID=1282 RepID=UPI0011AA0AC8
NLDQRPAAILDAQHLPIQTKQPITIIHTLTTPNHNPLLYSLHKIPKTYLTSTHYQHTTPSILQPIKPSTNHLIIHPQIHLQPITYQPHISQLLNPSPHQPLMLLKLLHY